MKAVLKKLVADLGELGAISDEPGKLTRTFLSPAMARATQFVSARMQAAGLTVRTDSVGNIIGRFESAIPNAPTLLLGSHLDTVRDAGNYDGPLGVLLPIAALAEIRDRGVRLPFHVEVIGFSEEEGVRFASAYLGSEGYTGKLKEQTLQLKDVEGVTIRAALEKFNGGKFMLPKPTHARRDLLGYVEVHIEQGPVLEAEKIAVGVVSAIAGQSRFKLTWTGKAGHAGTTPMKLRRDALAGAAEFTLAAEQLARASRDGLVATIGALSVAPGAANVIPGGVVHTLDVRHARDASRKKALLALGKVAAQIAKRRGLKVSWQRTQDNGAVACSPELTDQLARVVKSVQGRSLSLVSGAGHDGVVMAQLTEIAMLFVRCREGLSHHPDEYAAPKDIGVALAVIVEFLLLLSEQPQG
ncbi:allantoate amidohydrolase [Oleiharenicola lentus]|uniref:allantoate amidohydrolase n=1 Tax=Oleiharenicola lentus TaxID=2508720 RepID=UPI003F673569